jgi:uncharacterized protein DUF2382
VGAEVRRRERVRLKKYLVTESVTKTVPVTREEVASSASPCVRTRAARPTKVTNDSSELFR